MYCSEMRPTVDRNSPRYSPFNYSVFGFAALASAEILHTILIATEVFLDAGRLQQGGGCAGNQTEVLRSGSNRPQSLLKALH
jgi:hypothetical protein